MGTEAESGDFKEVYTNFKIKVYGENVCAVFDSDYCNGEGDPLRTRIPATFPEEVNGKWNLVFYASFNISAWEDEVKYEKKILIKS